MDTNNGNAIGITGMSNSVIRSDSGRPIGVRVRGAPIDVRKDFKDKMPPDAEEDGHEESDAEQDIEDTFKAHDLNAPMHMVLISLNGDVTQVQVRACQADFLYDCLQLSAARQQGGQCDELSL
jgi:hypothetical protein